VVAWCRPRYFGRPAEDHGDLYSAERPPSQSARFALQADLIESHVAAWHRADRVPGSVVLFNIKGRPVHVGLYIGQGSFLHAHAPARYRPGEPATHLERLDDPVWASRIEGFYDRTA
jgi:cell wall-associated NlpC family hydrolase